MAKIENINTKMIITELHKAFNHLNRDYFEGKLPEPAILIQSRGNKKLTEGWCSVNKIWSDAFNHIDKYEINIVAESLNKGMIPVLTTLMHEMVHLHNLENNIKDTSRGNTYHNSRFKEEAEKRGLKITHAEKIGFSLTEMTIETKRKVYDEYGLDEKVFNLGRRPVQDKKKKKKSSTRKYQCPKCQNIVRATKELSIICGDCYVPFELVNPMCKYRCDDCDKEFEGDVETNECPHCKSHNISIVVREKDLQPDKDKDDNEEIEIIDVDQEEKEKEKKKVIGEYCCKGCGMIFDSPVGEEVACGECGSTDVVLLTSSEEEIISDPESEEEPETIEEPEIEEEDEEEPIAPEEPEEELQEEDDILGEGDDKVEVKQKIFNLPEPIAITENEKLWASDKNTGWNEERIRRLMKNCNRYLEKKHGHSLDISEIPMEFKNVKSFYGRCWYGTKKTRGRGADKFIITKFTFSKNLLENYSDLIVADIVKHEFMHGWVNTFKNSDQKHNDLYKRFCKEINCEGASTCDIKPLQG